MFILLFPVRGGLTETVGELKVVEESVKKHDATLSEINEKISALPDFTAYERNIAEIGDRLNKIGEQSEQLTQKLKSLENLGTQIEIVDQAINNSISRIEVLEKALIELRQISEKKDTQISELTTKLNQLETLSTEIPLIKDQIIALNVDQRFADTAQKIEFQNKNLQKQIEALKVEFEESLQKNESERLAFIEKLDFSQKKVEEQKQELVSFQSSWEKELETLKIENETRLSQIQDKLNTQQNLIQTRISEIDQLKESLTQLSQKVSSFEESVNNVQGLETKVADLGHSMTNLEGKMSTMKTTVESEVQSIRNQIEALSSSLQGMETKQQSSVEEITNLKEQLAQLMKYSTALSQYETLLADLDTIKRTLAETTSQFVAQKDFQNWKQPLEKTLADSTKTIENLRGEMSTMKTTVESEVQSIRNQIEALSSSLQGMETKQQSFVEEMTNLSSLINSSLSNMDSKANVLESNLKQLEEAQKTIVTHSDQLEVLVNGFNRSLEDTKNQVVNLTGKLEERLDQIKTEFTVGQEKTFKELQAQIEEIRVTLPNLELLKKTQSKINELAISEESLKQKIESIQNEKAMILSEIEEHGENIVLLQENLENIRSQQPSNDEAVISIEEKIQSLQSFKDELETRIVKTDEQLKLLEAATKEWENKWEAMNDLLEKNTSEVKQLIEEVKNEYQKVQVDIAKKIDEEKLKSSLDTFNISMNQILDRVGKLEQFNQELTKKEIFARVDAIESEIAVTEGKIESIIQERGISMTEVTTLKEAIDDLKENKLAIEEKVDKLFDTLDEQKFIEETQQSLQNMNQEKDNLRVEIERLSGERFDIEEDLKVKQEELNRIDQELITLKEEKQSAENIQKLEEEKKRIEKEVQNLTREVENKLNQIEILQKKIQELAAQLDESKKYTSYVILPCDNLWKIARRYYRDGTKWKKILEANPGIIDSPYNLQPYTEIKIPRLIALNE